MNKLQVREQVKALLNRNDVTDAQLDSFLDLSLGRIQRTLRIPAMENAAFITFTEEFPDSFFLPLDFLEFKDIYTDQGVSLEFKPLGSFLRISAGNYYTRTGGRVAVKYMPGLGSSLTLLYYSEFPDLTTDTGTNWLTDSAPDLLIYGALTYAADFFVDDRRDSFEMTYQRTYGEIEQQAFLLEMSGADKRVTPTYSDY